jgi:hypothetical protein
VFQAKGKTPAGHVRWSEQNLTSVTNAQETWSTQSHDWVTVLEDTGIGEDTGFVLRRIDLQSYCDPEDGKRAVLEFAFPSHVAVQLGSGTYPTVRMRWVRVKCDQEVGFGALAGPGFSDTKWQIVAAFSDPT